MRDDEIYQVDADVNTGRHFEGVLLADDIYWILPLAASLDRETPYQLKISLSP